jgi:retinol-binding protein 3
MTRHRFSARAVAESIALLGLLLSPGAGRAENPASHPLDAATRAAIVDSVCAVLDSVYVFPETAAKMEALLRESVRSGAYDRMVDLQGFTIRLTEDLRSISKDLHLGVAPLPPGPPAGSPAPSPDDQAAAQIARRAKENFGFARVERLTGNVGYLDLRSFDGAEYAGKTALSAMNFLGHCDAVIFDLRQNGGGDPSMIQLLTSCLVPASTHLNDFYIRRGDHTQQFWTPAYTGGPDLSKAPVFVLTSSYTFSGAEEFSYNLKNLKRATIVGETTGGGAHPVNDYAFPELGVMARVPFGRAINPISGTNWEGTGVEPDIKIPADEALHVAHREALNALLAGATDPDQKQALSWAKDGIELAARPVSLDVRAMRAFEGTYGPRRVWVENGALHYQRAPQPAWRLAAYADDTFLLEGLESFRLHFVREGGRVTKLVGLYQDGRITENARD